MMDINLKSKGEALEWYRDVVKNGNVSQETLKDEVMKYMTSSDLSKKQN